MDANEVRIPAAYEGALVVDPGWDGSVIEHDGTFVAASKLEHALRYTAIDSPGNVLWAAERPPATGRQSTRSSALADGDEITGELHGTHLLLYGPVVSAHTGPGTTLWSTDLSETGCNSENEALVENIGSRSGLITLCLDDSTRAQIDMHDGSAIFGRSR